MAPRPLGSVLAAALLAQSPGTAAAQIPTADRAVFVVRQGGRIVGQEELVLQNAGGPAGDDVTITVVNAYDHAAPRRTFARLGRRRVTIRIEMAAGETAREYPNRPGSLFADEWVLGLYAAAAGTPPGTVSVVYPRSGRRLPAQLEDHGTQRTTLGDEPRDLRHVVIRFAAGEHHLWFDAEGRLMKVAIPDRNLVAERRIR